MKTLSLTLITLIFTAACGSNNKNANTRIKDIDVSNKAKMTLADKSSVEKVICKQHKRTGTNRISTICRSESEIAELRRLTQNNLRKGIGKHGGNLPSKKVGNR